MHTVCLRTIIYMLLYNVIHCHFVIVIHSTKIIGYTICYARDNFYGIVQPKYIRE